MSAVAASALRRRDVFEVGRDTSAPAVLDNLIIINAFENPQFQGYGAKMRIYQENACYNLPMRVNKQMSSYALSHGLCDFFEEPNCVKLIFMSTIGVTLYPVLAPEHDNKASSFLCAHGGHSL